ncbi:hypothetical protein E2C01_092685 [Portunus trituberculatus]|uniref:Uncharacterized protein n=1 Tax=Portunus trituberculatus TaxID=210409 RepID=A0A5B7JSE3_PORTR|nr:hypothetical protein [Portunus trituberculatus]
MRGRGGEAKGRWDGRDLGAGGTTRHTQEGRGGGNCSDFRRELTKNEDQQIFFTVACLKIGTQHRGDRQGESAPRGDFITWKDCSGKVSIPQLEDCSILGVVSSHSRKTKARVSSTALEVSNQRKEESASTATKQHHGLDQGSEVGPSWHP